MVNNRKMDIANDVRRRGRWRERDRENERQGVRERRANEKEKGKRGGRGLYVCCISQISSRLELSGQGTRVLVTSVAPSPGSQMATTVAVSIDYTLLFSKPSMNFTSFLEERLSLLPSSGNLGGIPVDSNGTFGYQGFYLSGKQP
jgi:hypothetical protein